MRQQNEKHNISTDICEFGMLGGTEQRFAIIPQETQSIPDWLSVPTLCYFLSTCQGSLEFRDQING